MVDIDISLPEGTEVRRVQGLTLSAWFLRNSEPEVTGWRIEEGELREIPY
jgi:hypothetical protein